MSISHGVHRQLTAEELIPASHGMEAREHALSPKWDPLAVLLDDPGLQDVVSFHAAHGGLVRHLMNLEKPLVWIQDRLSQSELGAPSSRMVWLGAGRSKLLFCPTRNAHDALWAMEEAVKAGVNVIGEISGAPKVLDFTATRRLELFSRASGVRCMLVRTGQQAGDGGSSGARWRWRVENAASEPDPYDCHAPGKPRWCLDLLRARSRPPGRWIVESGNDEEGAPDRLRVVSPLATGNVDARPTPQAEAHAIRRSGNVVSLR